MTEHQKQGWRLASGSFALTASNAWFAFEGGRLAPFFAVLSLMTLVGGVVVLTVLLRGDA